MNKYTGYLKYIRNDFYNCKNLLVFKKCDIELSTDNKRSVFKSIKCLLDKTLKSELQTLSCKYNEYYCEEHTIHNHECIDVNEYYHDTDEEEFYNIGYLNYDIYNKYVTNYNKYHSYLNYHKISIEDIEYYIFKKPCVSTLIKNPHVTRLIKEEEEVEEEEEEEEEEDTCEEDYKYEYEDKDKEENKDRFKYEDIYGDYKFSDKDICKDIKNL